MTQHLNSLKTRALVLFYVSLMAICGELCFGLMLGLKAFSHMVYVVLSFALLGYGVGSMLFLFVRRRLEQVSPATLVPGALALTALFTVSAAFVLPRLPIEIDVLRQGSLLLSLSSVYLTVALPFVGMGFLIAYLFSENAEESGTLYFWDLIGAGLGALAFFPLISILGPLRSLLLLSALALILAAWLSDRTTRAGRLTTALQGLLSAATLASLAVREPTYRIDPLIGIEWIPGTFTTSQYDETWRKWHALGRSDLHRMKDPDARDRLYQETGGSLEICLNPRPEFSLFTNNYRAGTPVFDLSKEGLARSGSRVDPFSQSMESPYVLLERPRVLVIGTGGGRDIFMAKVHGATGVTGAEINPATFEAMSPGGVAYEYSGRIYTADDVQVQNIDGRHLAMAAPPASQDLIILNGIDTFAALATGSYAFAENYLYTQEAIEDYLRALKPSGLINFNRWFELARPRETLRLVVMALKALSKDGAPQPWNHVIVGHKGSWGLMLIKRSPFTPADQNKVLDYFAGHDVRPVYSPYAPGTAAVSDTFRDCVNSFKSGTEDAYVAQYWADISSVHDDSPFFYKFYRFRLEHPLEHLHPGGGATTFYIQAVIVGQTMFFILLFIALPLLIFGAKGLTLLPRGSKVPFILFFACIGVGFIFIEITLMQRTTLILGSPIYAISVTLAALLLSSGVGSLMSTRWAQRAGSASRFITAITLLLVVYSGFQALLGQESTARLAGTGLFLRIAAAFGMTVPLGILLGCYFPTGLKLVGPDYPSAVVWAWGINLGFTVLGSTVSIVLAQFLGFRYVLGLSMLIYILAGVSFHWAKRSLTSRSSTPTLQAS